MEIVSTAIGYALVFESKKDLRNLANILDRQYNWAKENDIDPPYVFASCDSEIPIEKLDKLVMKIKERGTVS